MKPVERAQLQYLLQHFDDAVLVAMANKGLVRRAVKDLQAGAITHEETPDAVCVRGPGWRVTMPIAGPTQATDDSKATGITRHILVATMYLRDHWASGVDASHEVSGQAVEQALLALSFDDLQKWAGKTIVAEALSLLQADRDIVIDVHAGLTIHLIRHDVEARILPGRARSSSQLLDAIMTTAPKAQHQRWVVAAVAALHQVRGKPITWPEAPTPAEASGTPRTRREILANIMALLQSMIATGLAHPSDRVVQQLYTLSVSATGVHLPRLARLLRTLADDISLLIARDAQADTRRLFDRLCRTYTLAQATEVAGGHPPAAFVGQHRTRYTPVGSLQLVGTGAYPWQAASGHEGLTLLFWDMHHRRFRTFTMSRPTQGAASVNFSPHHAYTHDDIWAIGSPAQLCRSQIALTHAHANAWDRLSATQKTGGKIVGPSDGPHIDFGDRMFCDWQALARYARSVYPMGLRERHPLDHIVVVQPAVWGARYFDDLQQTLIWSLEDEAGHVLQLTLPWLPIYENAIAFLEALKPSRDRVVAAVVRLHFHRQGLAAEPLSFLGHGTEHGGVLNPAFDRPYIQVKYAELLDRLRQKFGRYRMATTMTPDDDLGIEEGLGDDDNALPPSLQTHLCDIENIVLQLAETGTHRLSKTLQTRLEQLAHQAQRVGLSELGQAVTSLANASIPAVYIIRTGYLCRLYREAIGARGLPGQTHTRFVQTAGERPGLISVSRRSDGG